MGVFHIGDAIILSWSQGNLDILQGQTTQKLYRYFKLRDQRTTREERAMFYRQVLNAGNAQTLENMVVNEDFPVLWETLLTTAKDYYDAFQSKDYNPRVVSKQSVFQAIRELQHNLSVNCSGMVKAIIPELYAHLQSCFEIIDQKEVADQLGNGVDKTRWKVIENVHKSLTNQKPPVLAYLTIAVEGNKIFRFIADFNASAVTNEVFDEFIQSTERYRVASQQLQAPTRKGLLPGMPAVPKETKKEQLQKIDDWDF
jgi:hypothetical protein